jgi:hypothetical protein
MRLSSAYTPQAVVGGIREFVGSNHSALDAALERVSNDKPSGDVTLTARRDGNSVIATIHATVPASDDLMVVVTEDGVTTTVQHGENAGRTITNDAIVRKLLRVTPGQTTITIPVDATWRCLSAAAFLQDRNTLAIGAAAAVAVRP